MKKPEVSYGVIADCQFADADDTEGMIRGASGSRFRNCYRMSEQKLEEAVDTFLAYKKEKRLDYVVHLGDFYDRDMDEVHRLNRILGRVGVRVLHLFGNHEWTDPRATMQGLLSLYNMPSNYYSVQKGRSRLIMLDTNELGPLEHPVGSPEWKAGHIFINRMRGRGAINAHEWNGGLSDQQLEWFDQELTDAEKDGQWAIPMAHHQIFPHNSLSALNNDKIMEVVRNHDNARVFLNGHNHGGAYGLTREKALYITLPGMLSGGTNAYGVSELYDDHFELKGFGTRVLDTRVDF